MSLKVSMSFISILTYLMWTLHSQKMYSVNISWWKQANQSEVFQISLWKDHLPLVEKLSLRGFGWGVGSYIFFVFLLKYESWLGLHKLFSSHSSITTHLKSVNKLLFFTDWLITGTISCRKGSRVIGKLKTLLMAMMSLNADFTIDFSLYDTHIPSPLQYLIVTHCL